MQRRRFLARLLTLAALPGALAGCAGRENLVLGIHPWIGYESLHIARDFGWLPARVELRQGQTAGDSLAGLVSGQLDAAALTLDEVLSARSAGVPLIVVLVFDVSAGADVLLVRPEISHLAGLANKRIGVENSAVGELVLHQALERAGLGLQDVTVVDLSPDRQVEAWRSGRIDAVVSYEPTASRLKAEGAVSLFDSRQMPNKIFDVLAIRRDRVEAREDVLRALLIAHFRALQHLRSNREDALYRIATRQGIDIAAARRALAGVILPDLAGNRLYFADGSDLEAAARRLNQVMVGHGLLAQPDSLANLFDPRYLPTELP